MGTSIQKPQYVRRAAVVLHREGKCSADDSVTLAKQLYEYAEDDISPEEAARNEMEAWALWCESGNGTAEPEPEVQRQKSEPHIKWTHSDGPLLVCSDGTLHWLTLIEKLWFKIGLEDINSLNEKHRSDRQCRP